MKRAKVLLAADEKGLVKQDIFEFLYLFIVISVNKTGPKKQKKAWLEIDQSDKVAAAECAKNTTFAFHRHIYVDSKGGSSPVKS